MKTNSDSVQLHAAKKFVEYWTFKRGSAVLAAYGLAPDTPEPEIVAHLFKLYAEMTKAN